MASTDLDLEIKEASIEREQVLFPDGRRTKLDYGDFRPAVFRHVAGAVDLEYRRMGRVPTVDELKDRHIHLDRQTIAKLYAFEPFKRALSQRGIPMEENAGLTDLQVTALLVLCDPTDKRSVKSKMAQFGLPYTTYQAWMRNPLFAAERSRRAEENLKDAVPLAIDKLIGNVDSGSQQAIEFTLAMSGRWSPQLQSLQDAKAVVYAVLEAVQIEFGDQPEKLQKLLNRVQATGIAFDSTHKELQQ